MYVQPTTDIYLLHGVPLDNTYDHTLYFSTITDQYNYFYSCRKLSFNNQTFQRVSRGFARVQADIGRLYDCNYMMFRNELFGGKWFYAFITSTEYINNQCSQINFEIDVLQTWHFNYKLDHCFIERQHTQTDNIGDNILPEPVEVGEYVCNGDYDTLLDVRNMVVVLGVVDTTQEEDEEVETEPVVNGRFYDRVYGGVTLTWYNTYHEALVLLNRKLATYVNDPDAVVCLYMCPSAIIPNYSQNLNFAEIPNGSSAREIELPTTGLTGTESIGGYSNVQNKKLYTYPYNYYHVDNGSGSELTVRYEFFGNHIPTFVLNGCFTQPCRITLRPVNYKDVLYTLNTEIITMDGYPLCSWNMDAYKAWVAQNSIPLLTDTALKTAGGIIGMATGTPLGMIGGAISLGSSIKSLLNQNYKASIQADICKGNTSSSNANVSAGKQQYYGGRFSVTGDYAKMIDDFFTRFGYAINEVAIPIRNARPHWTYIKTAGCTISPYTASQSQSGGVPNDDMRKICSIYNEGITWWKNPSEVGDYSLNNKPV